MTTYYHCQLFLLAAVVNCAMLNSTVDPNHRADNGSSESFLQDFEEQWSSFKGNFSRNYNETEELWRKKHFRKNLIFIREHNSLYEKGLKTHTLQLNEFSDWSDEEFGKLNGFIPLKSSFYSYSYSPFYGTSSYEYDDYSGDSSYSDEYESTTSNSAGQTKLPAAVDWRQLGYVTPVRNQRRCGSCYSFAATGALEALHKKITGKLVALSQQNIIDCSWQFGNLGCRGGTPAYSYNYVSSNGGIDSLASYPYTAKASFRCKYRGQDKAARDYGYVNVQPDEMSLKKAVALVGPVSVGIMASLPDFRFYASGIYSDPDCTSEYVDHAVLVVGYGTDPQTGIDYWIVKNSWGSGWGVDGYIYIARNQGDMCGISSMANYPIA